MPESWIGRVIASRYRLERLLGRGPLADVYAAQDLQLQRPVAVKLLRAEAARDPAARAAFQAEAEQAAGLNHPHVARVYDAGVADERPYLVQEHVPGTPLAAWQPADAATAVEVTRQAAAALAALHAQGLVHGAVTPETIVLDDRGQARLVDLGPPGAAPGEPGPRGDAATQPLVEQPAAAGALPYLSPERLAGGPATVAGDVYSLAAVLYGLLAGAPPYPGESAAAVRRAQQAGPPPPLATRNPMVPPALSTVLERALGADPPARFATAPAFDAALATVLRAGAAPTGAVTAAASAPTAALGGGDAAGAVPRPYVPAAAPAAAGGPSTAAAPPRARRWGPALLVGVGLLALLLALIISGAISGPRAAAGPSTPPGTAVLPGRLPAPQLVGLTLAQAGAAVQQGGWHLVAGGSRASGDVPAGHILAQAPAAGTSIAAGAPITVTTSLGPPPTNTPPPAPTATSPPPATPPAAPHPPAPQPPAHDPPGHQKKGGDNGNGKGKGDK